MINRLGKEIIQNSSIMALIILVCGMNIASTNIFIQTNLLVLV